MTAQGSLLEADEVARAIESAINSRHGLYRKGLDFPTSDKLATLSITLVDDEDALERGRSENRRREVIDHLVAGEYVKAANVLRVNRRPLRVPERLSGEEYPKQAAFAICLRQAREGTPPSLNLFAYLAACEERAKLAKASEPTANDRERRKKAAQAASAKVFMKGPSPGADKFSSGKGKKGKRKKNRG